MERMSRMKFAADALVQSHGLDMITIDPGITDMLNANVVSLLAFDGFLCYCAHQ